ncbi:hypothetical protein H4582DRAFT_853102 [Lactarius indigo]|nr:hypothetical protein H4582DRAFT_853102 [Lactarius indigo]
MGLEGLPLLDFSDTEAGIPTPAELMETILHSMIGHYNLFLVGVLPRDISSGNILRLREPIHRPEGHSMNLLRHVLIEDVNLSLCRGFLIDGDHAIKWDEYARTPSPERSGTLPFMSTHLLQNWSTGLPALHTAIGDLESFLWVLVWSLVHILKKFANITNETSIIHRIGHTLSSSLVSEVLTREHKMRYWKDIVFGDLIRKWVEISETSRRANRISTPSKGFRMNLTSAVEKPTRNSFKWGTITLEKLGISLTGMRL